MTTQSFGTHAVAAMSIAANYTVEAGQLYCWKVGFTVHYVVRAYHSSVPSNNDTICTFPAGYRPDNTVIASSSIGYQGDYADAWYISTGGVMKGGSPVGAGADGRFFVRMSGVFTTSGSLA
jgi:hypothetical protein